MSACIEQKATGTRTRMYAMLPVRECVDDLFAFLSDENTSSGQRNKVIPEVYHT